MKHLFTFSLIITVTLFSLKISSQTYVSGFLSTDTTWTLAGSPYIITGNTLLSQGSTLTIEPGVIVKFDANKAIQIDGELIAIGTSANRIVFTSNQTTPTNGYWAKIHFSDYSDNAVFDVNGNYLSGSVMKYCDVKYGGGLGYGLIHVVNSSPYFSNCSFSYSYSSGIYFQGTSCVVDSCLIKSCNTYGLSFSNITTTSCGLRLTNDSILNNTGGGIFSEGSIGCTAIINRNYFYGNTGKGAIFFNDGCINKIIENVFNNNTCNTSNGMIHVLGDNSEIKDNTFINNSAIGSNGMISLDGSYSKISNNTFTDNTASGSSSLVYVHGSYDSVKCNTFNSNTLDGANGIIWLRTSFGSITKNIFENNSNSDQYGVVVTNIEGNTGTQTTKFENNIIQNNSCPNGYCCKFNVIIFGIPSMIIKNNSFLNNNSKYIAYLTVTNSGGSYNLEFKNNNLNNPLSQYEFYNNVPYGSPDSHLDSNYWGTTNTSHINQVIFDYFDDANYSVVYYSPLLSGPANVDTSCSAGFPVMTEIVESEYNHGIYPNPFYYNSMISLDDICNNATLTIYNTTGKPVKEINGLSGRELNFEKGDLPPGIYLLTLTEGSNMLFYGKAVIIE